MSFWERYENLCSERNLSPQSKILLDSIGVSSGTVTGWKRGSQPKFDAVAKIAAYFHVDIRYLLGLTDMRYGEDVIEEVSEYINDAGFEINCYEDENGSGREYTIGNDEVSMLMQEHEFRDLCQEILTDINTAKLDITETHVKNHFKPFQGTPAETTDPVFEISPEEQALIEKYRQLNTEGKTMVNAAIIQEIRRQE